MGGIKNILPALVSIIIGFAISTLVLNMYLDKDTENENTQTVTTKIEKEVVPEKKEVITPLKKEKTKKETKNTTKSINLKNIQENYENWKAYHKENIDLMSTFIPIDNNGGIMDKGIFLISLRTGAYIPVKSKNEQNKIQYTLTAIMDVSDEKIKKSIVSKANVAYQYFKMEGKKLPRYNFVDLKGKTYNKADTKGKLLVLKCWFITCKVCVEEFPELNALVDKYKDKKIEFISLAFDKKDELIAFLETKDFKYSTVPGQKKYMSKKLKVKQYPTHLIVDSNGVIIKMVNNVKTLTSELKLIMGK